MDSRMTLYAPPPMALQFVRNRSVTLTLSISYTKIILKQSFRETTFVSDLFQRSRNSYAGKAPSLGRVAVVEVLVCRQRCVFDKRSGALHEGAEQLPE